MLLQLKCSAPSHLKISDTFSNHQSTLDGSFDGRVVTQSDLGGGGDLPQGKFSIITDVVEVSFTNSAKKSDRVGSYCFPVNQSSVVTAQSFLTDCHDTRPAGADPKGDPYLRLLANDVEGELVVENDDVDSTCAGAALRDLFLQKGML